MHAGAGEAPPVLRAVKDAPTGKAALPHPLSEQRSWEARLQGRRSDPGCPSGRILTAISCTFSSNRRPIPFSSITATRRFVRACAASRAEWQQGGESLGVCTRGRRGAYNENHDWSRDPGSEDRCRDPVNAKGEAVVIHSDLCSPVKRCGCGLRSRIQPRELSHGWRRAGVRPEPGTAS